MKPIEPSDRSVGLLLAIEEIHGIRPSRLDRDAASYVESALEHLLRLQVDAMIEELTERIERFQGYLSGQRPLPVPRDFPLSG